MKHGKIMHSFYVEVHVASVEAMCPAEPGMKFSVAAVKLNMLPTPLLLGSKDNQLLVIHRGKHTYCSCRWS